MDGVCLTSVDDFKNEKNFQSLTNEYANYYNCLVQIYQVGSGSFESFFECDFDYIDFLINTKNVHQY